MGAGEKTSHTPAIVCPLRLEAYTGSGRLAWSHRESDTEAKRCELMAIFPAVTIQGSRVLPSVTQCNSRKQPPQIKEVPTPSTCGNLVAGWPPGKPRVAPLFWSARGVKCCR